MTRAIYPQGPFPSPPCEWAPFGIRERLCVAYRAWRVHPSRPTAAAALNRARLSIGLPYVPMDPETGRDAVGRLLGERSGDMHEVPTAGLEVLDYRVAPLLRYLRRLNRLPRSLTKRRRREWEITRLRARLVTIAYTDQRGDTHVAQERLFDMTPSRSVAARARRERTALRRVAQRLARRPAGAP